MEVLHEHAAAQRVRRGLGQGDAELTPYGRGATVRSDDETAGHLVLDVVVLVANAGVGPACHHDVADPPHHCGPSLSGSGGERLARLGVTDVEHATNAGKHVVQVEGVGPSGLRVGDLVESDEAVDVGPTRIEQLLLQAEFEEFDHSPAVDHLAAHLVPVNGLSLQEQDVVSVTRKRRRQGGSGYSSPITTASTRSTVAMEPSTEAFQGIAVLAAPEMGSRKSELVESIELPQDSECCITRDVTARKAPDPRPTEWSKPADGLASWSSSDR